jgi:hypothetical protein
MATQSSASVESSACGHHLRVVRVVAYLPHGKFQTGIFYSSAENLPALPAMPCSCRAARATGKARRREVKVSRPRAGNRTFSASSIPARLSRGWLLAVRPAKSHISRVVKDSSWVEALALALKGHAHVLGSAKNQAIQFDICTS